jgi:uncharacterized protein
MARRESKTMPGKTIHGPVHMNRNEEKAVNELLEGLKAEYGENLEKVILYGSRARGDHQEESDIDLLIVLKEMGLRYDEIKRINTIASPLCLKYRIVISAFPVRVERIEDPAKSPFMENAVNEGVVL